MAKKLLLTAGILELIAGILLIIALKQMLIGFMLLAAGFCFVGASFWYKQELGIIDCKYTLFVLEYKQGIFVF